MRKRRTGLIKAVICSICCLLLLGVWVFSTRMGFGTQIGYVSGAVEDGVLHIYGGGQWAGTITKITTLGRSKKVQEIAGHTWDAKRKWGWELPSVVKGFVPAPVQTISTNNNIFSLKFPGFSTEIKAPQIGKNNPPDRVLWSYSTTSNSAIGVVSAYEFVIHLPLWMAMAVSVPVTVLLWRRVLVRQPPEQCVQCGYNLTGNISGICPECGDKRIKDKG